MHLCAKMGHRWIPSIYNLKAILTKSDIPTSKINKNYINPKRKSPQTTNERAKECSPSFKRRGSARLKEHWSFSFIAWFRQGLTFTLQANSRKSFIYIYIEWSFQTRAKSPDWMIGLLQATKIFIKNRRWWLFSVKTMFYYS